VDVGRALQLRIEPGLADVAERSGVHRMSIARPERAGIDLQASTLVAIAQTLGVRVCQPFGERKRARGDSNTRPLDS
jgi:transcriptional regulator with XRE-family HTH domain